MAFNPDKYIQKKEQENQADNFNPEAYLASKSPEEAPEGSNLQAAAEGAVEGATAGLKPILGGVSRTALDTLSGVISPKDILDRYRQYRDAEQAQSKQLQDQSPKSFLAGQIGGGLIPAALTGGGEGLLGAAKIGAGYGATEGLAQSPADLTQGQVGQAALDTAKGAAAGGIIGGATSKLMGALSAAPELLEKYGARKAVAALGGTKAQVKNLVKNDMVVPTGQELLKSGIVAPLKGSEAMLDKAEQVAETSGKQIGDILNKFDVAATTDNPELKQQLFNPQDAISKIKDLQSQFTKNGKILSQFEPQYNQLDKAIDTVASFGDQPIPFTEANQLKNLIDKTAYDEKGTLQDKLMGQVRSIVNDGIEEAADRVAKQNGDSDLLSDYLKNKQTYGTAKTAINSLTGKVAGDIKANDLGLTDYMTGAATAVMHGGPVAVATVGLKKLVNAYGKGSLATGASGTANLMSNIGSALSAAPEALKGIGQKLTQSDNELHVKLGHILTEAADRDDTGRNALIFSLMQSPQYRDIMKKIMPHKEEQ